MTISEVVIVFLFIFLFYCISIGTFKSTKKNSSGLLTVLGISQTIKATHIYRNMLMVLFYIFWHSTWTCLFQFLFVITAQKLHTVTWFIFISAYKCYVLTIIIFLGLFISRIIFYTDASFARESRTSFKRRKTKKKGKRHPCSSLYFGCWILFNIVDMRLAANPVFLCR